MSPVAWAERPVEQARLLNPAFLATLIWAGASEYSGKGVGGVPFPLLFITVPVVLHGATRQALPKAISSPLSAWLADHPEALVGFPDRVITLAPFVKEAILFGSKGGLLGMSGARVIAVNKPKGISRYLRDDATSEVAACIGKARLMGRWLARSGDYRTVMALWGIAP